MATPRRRREDSQSSGQLSGLDYRAQGNAASQNRDYEDAIASFTAAQDIDWREEDKQENIAAVLLGRATAYYHLEQNDLGSLNLSSHSEATKLTLISSLALFDLLCLQSVKSTMPRAH